MNPGWNSHRIGGPRRRRVWRLTCACEIRAIADPRLWGRVSQVEMLPPPWSRPGSVDIRLQVQAQVPGPGTLHSALISEPVTHPHRESAVVDSRHTAWTRTPIRRIGRLPLSERISRRA